MSDWPSESIGALCEFDPSKSRVRDLADSTRVSFLPMSELGFGGQAVSGHQTRSIADAYKGYTYFADGDVLLAKITPCFENGKLGVADGLENEIGFGSSEFMVLRPGPRVVARYLAYYLSQDRFRELGAKAMTGAVGHKRVPKEWVQDFEIPLPPLAEQQRIVAVLDEDFEAIAAALNLEEVALQAIVLLESSLLDRAIAEAATLGPTVPLEQVCMRLTVGHVGPMMDRYVESGVPFLRSQNVRPFELDLNEVKFIDQGFDDELRKSRLRPGDVAIVRTGYPGTASVIPQDLPLSNCADMVIASPSERLDPHFLALFLNSPSGKALVGNNLTGAAQKHFNVGAAKRAPIPVPPRSEQSRIVEWVTLGRRECGALKRVHQRKADALAELKQSLLARAFAGELTGRSAVANDNCFATPEQAANILAFMHWRHERSNRSRFFGHVMAQKALDLMERVGGVELGRRPYKDAAGPNDKPHMKQAEVWAREKQFFEFVERTGGGYDFKKLANYGAMLSAAKAALKPIEADLDRVANILVGKDKVQAEIFATVLAAWNNLIIDGKDATEASILREARDDWHPDKIDLPVAKFQDAIREIRRLALVPDGTAKAVRHKQAALF